MKNKNIKLIMIFVIFLLIILFVNLSSSQEQTSIVQNPQQSSNYIALAADVGGAIIPGFTGSGSGSGGSSGGGGGSSTPASGCGVIKSC